MIYRHLEPAYIEELFEKGKYRIGTLFAYRDIESEIEGIIDQSKGYIDKIYNFHTQDSLKFYNIEAENVPDIYVVDCKVTESTDNMFISCFSLNKEWENKKLSAIELINPLLFLREVSKCISTQTIHKKQNYTAMSCDIQPCIYKPKKVYCDNLSGKTIYPDPWHKPDYEVFIKQREIRAVWTPRNWKMNPKTRYIDLQSDVFKMCFKKVS